MLAAAIKAFERMQLVEIERRKAVELHRAQIAARSLHPQHRLLPARQGIGHPHLGRSIAAAEIGDPEITAQEIRAIEQKPRLAQAGGNLVVPQIGNGGFRHGVEPFTLNCSRTGRVSPSPACGRRWRKAG